MVNKRIAVISATSELILQHFNAVRADERKRYAGQLCEKLYGLSRHITARDLNTVEAVELIRQFAEDLKSVSEEQY